MSGGKVLYPYDYENVLLLKSESAPPDDEIEEKVTYLTFVGLIKLREFLQSFLFLSLDETLDEIIFVYSDVSTNLMTLMNKTERVMMLGRS